MHKIGADLSRRLEAQEKKNRCDCSIVFLISLISFSMYESIGMVCGSVSKINYDYVTALGSEGHLVPFAGISSFGQPIGAV